MGVETGALEVSATRGGAAIKVAGAEVTAATEVQQIPYLPKANTEAVAISTTPEANMRMRVIRIEQSFSANQTTPVPVYVEDGAGGVFPPANPLVLYWGGTFNLSEPEVQAGPGLPVTVRVPAISAVSTSVCLYFTI